MCNKCKKKNIIKKIETQGGKIINSNWEYINNIVKFEVVCNNNHIFKTNWSTLRDNSWCPYCVNKKVDEEDVRKFIENKGGKLEENWKYINNSTKFKIICLKCNNIFISTWHSITIGSWCPYCVGLKIDESIVRKKIECCGGILNNDWKYINNRTKFFVKGKCNHIWETTWAKIQQKVWCPYCKKKTEQRFRQVIENYFGTTFKTKLPKFLNFKNSKRNLELDGYNEELKIAFEYQGRHHYEEVSIFNKDRTLQDIQKYDKFKVDKCKELGICLIVIPYWLSEDKWIEEIQKQYNIFINNFKD